MYTSDAIAMLILSAYSIGLCAVAWACKEKRLLRL